MGQTKKMPAIVKPHYEIGTILVVSTWDGKHTNCYFFQLTKKRPNGNYIAKEFLTTQVVLPEFTTCEGYKKRLDLPATAEGGIVNLTWQRKAGCFSHLKPMEGFGTTNNEIYDPLKIYYNEA